MLCFSSKWAGEEYQSGRNKLQGRGEKVLSSRGAPAQGQHGDKMRKWQVSGSSGGSANAMVFSSKWAAEEYQSGRDTFQGRGEKLLSSRVSSAQGQ